MTEVVYAMAPGIVVAASRSAATNVRPEARIEVEVEVVAVPASPGRPVRGRPRPAATGTWLLAAGVLD
ncbi:hypothetical protein ACGFZJ_25405 [Streptomyces sp. NPDC048253]|uniref:hypothetical protein n=1 Tax=Streptomyces sp. NPDC048253 TaxID=3365524 RepID=UPI00371DEDE6